MDGHLPLFNMAGEKLDDEKDDTVVGGLDGRALLANFIAEKGNIVFIRIVNADFWWSGTLGISANSFLGRASGI